MGEVGGKKWRHKIVAVHFQLKYIKKILEPSLKNNFHRFSLVKLKYKKILALKMRSNLHTFIKV